MLNESNPKINKRSHCERWIIQLTKGRSRELSKQLQEFASIQPQESIAKLGCRELMKKKCLDEGLAQRLVSFNAKLTNFLKMELWVNLVDGENWEIF